MSPRKRLKFFILDPGTHAELAFLDLDLVVLAFGVLAASAGAGGFLWGMLAGETAWGLCR